jgi:hypothetical protein
VGLAEGSTPGAGFGSPPADTGNLLLNWISRALMFFIHLDRRFDPFFRPAFDALFRGPLSALITGVINLRRKL